MGLDIFLGAEASRETLIRGLSLDLTGIPPTIAEVEAFVADRSVDAYERVVDRLLARGPRFRLTPEMIRDQSLAASGLLVERIGGPAIRPHAPASSWDGGEGSGNLINYTPSTDDGLWRRGVYVFWKRTQPPPGMVVFDAPSREFCSVRRLRTNTPLQALATFNDVTTSVAARMLAVRIMGEADRPTAIFPGSFPALRHLEWAEGESNTHRQGMKGPGFPLRT
jgi:hypothetical protein